MARALGISADAWRKWVRTAEAPPPATPNVRGRRAAVSETVRAAIRKQYEEKHKQWGPAILAAWALRTGLCRRSPTTIGRIIADLREPREKRPEPATVRLTAAGVLWSEDGAGFREGGDKYELLALQDDCARFTVNHKLVDGPAAEEDVVAYMEEAFIKYSPPLVLKHDGGKIFCGEKVGALLDKYGVVDLTGPRYYPQYNGRRERAFRDLRSYERAIRKDDPTMPLGVRLNLAIKDLNDERPRPVLSGRTAAEVFARDRIELPDRQLFRKEVDATQKRFTEEARSRDEEQSARRRAIEAVLCRRGYLEIRQQCQPISGQNARAT